MFNSTSHPMDSQNHSLSVPSKTPSSSIPTPLEPPLNATSDHTWIDTSTPGSGQPKKKRKPTVRACDACAIRKVKCEVERPCRHCTANGLNCTQLRERKKSGPKNLHKKTLQSINSLKGDASKIVGDKEGTIIAANHDDHPIEMLPDSLTTSIGKTKLSTEDLISILELINDPILNSVLKEITLRLVLGTFPQMIDFIKVNFKMLSLELLITSSDPIYLSNTLSILSLILLIVENLSLLKAANFKLPFLRTISFYKDLKKLLLFKILEIFQIVDKILLFPSREVDQQWIFYNESVSSLYLSHYFNLTRDHNKLYADQQNVLHLRRAITYYQLINTNDKISNLNSSQVVDLFERLFLTERYRYLVSTNLVNSTNLFDLNNGITSSNALIKIFRLLNNDDMIYHKLKQHNILIHLYQLYKINHYPDINDLKSERYSNLKQNMADLAKTDLFYSILNQVLVFKVLMLYSNNLDLAYIKTELISVVRELNKLLVFNESLFLKFSNFNVLPQLIQILKINIDFENSANHMDELITFTRRIVSFFNTAANIDELLRSNKVIYGWFKEMNVLDVDLKGSFGQKAFDPHFNPHSHLTTNKTNITRPGSDLHSYMIQKSTVPQPQQIQLHLNRLQQSQGGTLPFLRQSVPSSVESKDKGELNVLLQDLGNSRLSSNSSTNTHSNAATNCATTPENLGQKEKITAPTERFQDSKANSSFSTIIQPTATSIPPIVTLTNIKKEDDLSTLNLNLNVSESTKNLYNLFTQMNDDVPNSQNNSLTNLFQFNSPSTALPKLSSLSNIRSMNHLNLLNSNSTLNLFMSSSINNEEEEEKTKHLKNQFLL